jgi:hypothetical protein
MTEDIDNRERAFASLDAFALLASQNYNLGNTGNWFFSFRAGLKGVRLRAQGWAEHNEALHSWALLETIEARERHIAGALFCMDSALECLVFALNAMGNAVEVSAFQDVTSRRALSRVSPRNVLGNASENPLPGYAKYFPSLQQRWLHASALISVVCDNHDVSKHRQATFWGGTLRDDPPEAIRRALEADDRLTIFSPMAEVLLPKDPKAPMVDMKGDLEHWVLFEDVERDLSVLLTDSLGLALADATKSIRRSENVLREEQSTA